MTVWYEHLQCGFPVLSFAETDEWRFDYHYSSVLSLLSLPYCPPINRYTSTRDVLKFSMPRVRNDFEVTSLICRATSPVE